MGFLEDTGPYLVAAAIAAIALLTTLWIHANRTAGRHRARADRLAAELRPARLYRVRARVDRSSVRQIGMHHLVDHLSGLEIDDAPPQADDGDELELAWTVLATSDEFAERQAGRHLERANLAPLALRVDHEQLA